MSRLLLLVCVFFFNVTSEARDLFGRMGLGYNAQFAQTSASSPGSPGISLKYGFNPRTMIEIIGGYQSGSANSGVGALKLMQTMHSESYINFYFMIGAGTVTYAARKGTEIITGFGSEFFIPGLESLGISFEAGLNYENLSSSNKTFTLRTFGASFINAGMHFYF
jgi:hypothetical protein